jgi:hypothetical protein
MIVPHTCYLPGFTHGTTNSALAIEKTQDTCSTGIGQATNMTNPVSDISGVPATAPSISHNLNRVRNACTECKRRKVRCDGTEPCY